MDTNDPLSAAQETAMRASMAAFMHLSGTAQICYLLVAKRQDMANFRRIADAAPTPRDHHLAVVQWQWAADRVAELEAELAQAIEAERMGAAA